MKYLFHNFVIKKNFGIQVNGEKDALKLYVKYKTKKKERKLTYL